MFHPIRSVAPDMILFRALPGAGKTTIGEKLVKLGGWNFVGPLEADSYFKVDGFYRFEPALLPKAHSACQDAAKTWIDRGHTPVVANTCTVLGAFGLAPYLEMGANRVVAIDLFDNGGDFGSTNVHGVPQNAIARMRDGFEWVGLERAGTVNIYQECEGRPGQARMRWIWGGVIPLRGEGATPAQQARAILDIIRA